MERIELHNVKDTLEESVDFNRKTKKDTKIQFMNSTADKHSLQKGDLGAVEATAKTAISYLGSGGSLEFPTLGIVALQAVTKDLGQIRIQFEELAFGYETLKEALSDKGIQKPTAKEIENILVKKYKPLQAGISSASACRNFLRILQNLRQDGYNLIYLFRDASMNWRLRNETVSGRQTRERIVALFGRYLEDLRHFPFVSTAGDIQAAMRAYFQRKKFPGSDSQWFTICGSHWPSFLEARAYAWSIVKPMCFDTISDEEILSVHNIYTRPMHYHVLHPMDVNGEQILTTAMSLEAGSILGIVAAQMRYVEPALAKSHWFQLPNGVYCEPLPGPFTLIFRGPDVSNTHGNVCLVYDVVKDPFSGVAPFRLFAVTVRFIAPLEPPRLW
ncbi:hypothetical protein PtrSN002B_010944 [Pyrenophora tritici-repentis]|uniref:Uncharacterized protein n=2 Tax=Pyrenophora tritici-repentis TaxID=45151 RepID=A0A2W1HTP3_9PLEO|nr:uncharacterized protein PTRG_00428 [Pyrenophora tritici-repentis Pt-1C-BFP]KAA8625030.1 hypothetical protein PtrV1_00710 [Pyrenophora tritici-repentis]EDU39866.1 predicted protein [Pyrenophora tritici-repentis Pt-1C-BFP]KAF7453423.1 hypothetical protein A1F99_006810 [Pyrenophora tritici-repentis]KAF7576497.1 hypothetical protein PtrM4_007370 [Pyrenophora tritici-repentis]KAG9387177.1 hypothetical protein A1F94_000069 [Pyrenophora tritici-repentis]